MTADDAALPPRIVLFDGDCGLCDRAIQVLVRIDRKRALRYAPLQGETARRLRERDSDIPDDVSTIAFVENDRVLVRSRAAFAILRHVGGPWRALLLFSWLPVWLTDAIYRLIARTRYPIFGKRDTCRVPTAAERELFLP